MTITRLFDLPYNQLENFPQEVALASKVNGKWETTSTQSLVDQANAASRGMLAMGIGPGDKIAMISNNRTEWAIMDMAILQIGAINVPIYPTITEDDYRYIFNHAEIKMCFVSDEELLTKVRNIASDVPSMDKIFTFDTIAGADHWSAVKDAGQGGDQAKVDTLKDAVKNEDIATIIYTSGTTGTPKGVLLTHNNVLSNAIASKDRLPVDTNAKSLSFLPICHIYERMLLYLYFYTGVSIYFAESLETIGDNLKEIKPEVFSAVPRLLEKVYDKIIEKGAALTGVKKALFFWAVSLGEQWEPYGANGAWYEFKLGIAKKIIFSKWQEALGGNALAVASGSAALQPRLARIFNAAGIPIMEGYGLTETSPVVAVNEMDNRGFMIGSVGRVLKDVEVKIAEDGEILVKGPNVMQGYYKDEEKTKEVFTEDGWFKTGDIGVMTGEGNAFLKITDRKKEIFKTSGGKYVAPQPIENELKGSRFIEQAMVVGEGKKHPAVIVVPHFESVEYWCEHHDIQYPGPEAAIKDERITARIWQEVERVNENLGKWEQPKKMALCSTVWGVDTGELTPTLKLKRRNILSKYANLMTDIYGE